MIEHLSALLARVRELVIVDVARPITVAFGRSTATAPDTLPARRSAGLAAALCALALTGASMSADSQTPPLFEDAALPGSAFAGPIRGPDGFLYGATYDGGDSNFGALYRASPDLTSVTVIHSFGGADGRVPYAELIIGSGVAAGKLFGTTDGGGPTNQGTVYSLDLASGQVTTILPNPGSYYQPNGPLLQIGDYLYGGTGSSPAIVYRVLTDGQAFEPIHYFSVAEGSEIGALTLGPDGYIYGTAFYGGDFACDTYSGCGTAFRLRPDGTDFSVLHLFGPVRNSAAAFPQRKLVYGSDGRLYGVTFSGVFSLLPVPGNADFRIEYTLPPQSGSYLSSLTEGSDGRLYVAHWDGGAEGAGRVFSVTKDGLDLRVHHEFSFSGGGYGPYGIPLLDATGDLYGTTEYSDLDDPAQGTIFAIRGVLQGNIATSTTLISSLNPSAPGQPVTFTATVTGGQNPQGSVTFSDGGSALGPPQPLSSGSASLMTSALTLGGHVITADYSGDAVNQPSSAQLTQNVVLDTVTSLVSTPNPSSVGQAVTFTATVTSGASPTGTVVFRDSGLSLGAPVPLVNGIAVLAVSSLGAGSHQITAEYGGDSSNRGSVSTSLLHEVNRLVPIVGLFSSRNPSKIGDAVILTATLPADADGSITFVDGAVTLDTQAVVFGEASTTTSALDIGVHVLIARYSGGTNYLPADSAPLNQTVNPLNSPPQIIPISPATLLWGRQLEIIISAFDLDGDAVTFSLDGAPAGATITPAGRLTWTPQSSQVGQTILTVRASDGLSSTTSSFAVNVNPHGTALSYDGPFAAAPGPVIVRATLRDVPDSVVLAGRAVRLVIGTQEFLAVTDATGTATASVVLTQPAGTVQAQAHYDGEPPYVASSSGAAPFRLSLPPEIAPVSDEEVPWGRQLVVGLDLVDADGDPLSVTLLGAPAGMTLSRVTDYQISWTPDGTQVGDWPVGVRATDGVTAVTLNFMVRVLPHNTTLTPLGGPQVYGRGPMEVTATLRDTEFDVPLEQRPVAFDLGTQSASAVTGTGYNSGIARGVFDLQQPPGTVTLSASFAGDLQYAPAQASRAFEIIVDSDGDGLPDEWEVSGVWVDGVFLDLPAMGANPLRKDIFIETDWMLREPMCIFYFCVGAAPPQPPALDALRATFAAAPVSNPDGSTGIALHIDAGPASIMDPATGALWGDMSRAGVVPYKQILGSFDASGMYDWSEFEAIKQVHFEPARRPVFHYVVYADSLTTLREVAGISRGIPASDVVVANTAFLSTMQESGLLMHEVGHNLALRHGGGDDLNYKTNYASVMNYQWTYVGIPPNGELDYSRSLLDPVDEAVTGDVNGDGQINLLLGYIDWSNVFFGGHGIGDLFALPAPNFTPLEQFDPDEMRQREAYAQAGDGLIRFDGPTGLAADSGARSLLVTVTNISSVDADYVVSIDSPAFPAPVVGEVMVTAGSELTTSLTVATDGLEPGDYPITIRLRSAAGALLHQRSATLAVFDLSTDEARAAALQAIEEFRNLPPDSGFDPRVVELIIDMLSVSRFEFGGFSPPVAGSDSWNDARAGQAIPVKWRLLTNGLPVSDPDSFAGVFSYPLNCSTAAATGDAVQESTPGSSLLTYKGDGQWQYVLKSPASYLGTCRAVLVRFSDGTASPALHLKFN